MEVCRHNSGNEEKREREVQGKGKIGQEENQQQREERESLEATRLKEGSNREKEACVPWYSRPSWFQAFPTGGTSCELAFATETLFSSRILHFCTCEMFGTNVESYVAGKRDQMSLKSSKLSLFFKKVILSIAARSESPICQDNISSVDKDFQTWRICCLATCRCEGPTWAWPLNLSGPRLTQQWKMG